MAWQGALADLEYDDEELYDRENANHAMEPPSHPPGCSFCLAEPDLIKAAGEGGEPGDEMRFAAMAEVTSCHRSVNGSRVELEIKEFAGDDGKFFDLGQPGHVSLTDRELDKMGLEANCEVGDLIHLVGEARLDAITRAEWGEIANLQIMRLSYAEDESEESR